jgi:hypothetical protein
MLAQDLMRFGIIYTMFIMGFAQAYYIMFQSFTVSSHHAMCKMHIQPSNAKHYSEESQYSLDYLPTRPPSAQPHSTAACS